MDFAKLDNESNQAVTAAGDYPLARMGDQACPAIEVKPFSDPQLEISGWYALGHYSPEVFLPSVVKRDPLYAFQTQRVKLGWARFSADRFDFTIRQTEHSQPITLIESWI